MNDLELLRGTIERDNEVIYWELARNAEMGSSDERPVIVLSHGAGGSHAVWYQQVPTLGQSYRIVTWDSRGFGNSSNATNRLSPNNAANDLGAVLDHLGIDRAHLVGQSMGGWHISAFWETYPNRTASLTYANTVGGLWTQDLRAALEEFGGAGGLRGSRKIPLVGGHVALWTEDSDRDVAHAFLYQALGSFHDPPLDQLGEITDFEISADDLGNSGTPVLFITSEHDPIFPSHLLRESAHRIDGSTFVELPAAGHSPYFETPSAWNAALLEFLASA